MTLSLKSIFDKSPRRAIYLSNDKLSVYHWNNGSLGDCYLFDASEDGHRYFDRYLKETPKQTTYMLVDVVEEEFRQDKIPHVSGSDRESVVARKKARLFRDTPYFYTEVHGREEEGRKDDRVIFMALTNPEMIEPWVELLDHNKVPLAGIYSLPQITKGILADLPKPSDHQLIVSIQSISGLRQTFFQNGKLKVSRMVPLPRYGSEPYAPIVHEEVELIQRYLNSLRLTNPESSLDIYYLGNKALLGELDMIQTDSSYIHHHRLDLDEYGSRLGLDTGTGLPFSDRFFISHLLKNKPKNTYARSKEQRYFKLKKSRQFMYAASALLLLGSFIWGGLNFMDGMVHKQQSTAAMKKTDFYNARYEIAVKKLKKTEVSPHELKAVAEIVKTLENHKADPFDMYKLVSKGLEQYPEIEIDEITWLASADPNQQPNSINRDNLNQGVVGYSNINPTGEEGYFYYQIGLLRGHIAAFDGNYRKAISTIESFRNQMDTLENTYDVSITSLPLDVSPDKSLQGTSRESVGDAVFSMRVVLGIKNESS